MKIRFGDLEDDYGVYEITHYNEEVKVKKEVENLLKIYKRLDDEYNIDDFIKVLQSFCFEVNLLDKEDDYIYF